MTRSGQILALVCATALLIPSCTNNPYPHHQSDEEVVLFQSFRNPPKDLDPQRTYTVADGVFVSMCYERLLGYAYLERPLKLTPELAIAVPEPQETRDATGKLLSVRYSFEIQPGVHFIDDPCFPGGKGRELTAADFVYAFKRVADPKTSCPVSDSFAHIRGFAEFRDRVTKLRAAKGKGESDTRISLPDLYAEAGNIEGVQLKGKYRIDVVLHDQYPQILYWLAMRFIPAVPWEAVEYYDGQQHDGEADKRDEFAQHPVGTGPFRFEWSEFNRRSRIVLVKNKQWWGAVNGDRMAPGTIFPKSAGSQSDIDQGIWTPSIAGSPVPHIDRIEWYLERESLARFSKFLQGYYDASGIPTENFDYVIENEQLTPRMAEKGIRLVKDYGMDVYYIGFNMEDDTIGAPVKFESDDLERNRGKHLMRNRKLRQAMSLAIDKKEYLRIFFNNLGVPAQSPLPPGMFGYDPDYKNPYAQFDPALELAKKLMVEAGYKNGIDPSTDLPLELTYDAGSVTTRSRAIYNFFIDSWRKLGINVALAATDYNKFQKKMHSGNYQVFSWGWLADYPDPENFLFLLYGPNSGKYGGHNPNHARYENARYDALFKKMETMKNNDSVTWEEKDLTGAMHEVTMTRLELIHELIRIFQDDCPWITLFHSEDYLLYHTWLKNVKPHPITGSHSRYYYIDTSARNAARIAWNRPVLWPLAVIAALVVAFTIPALITIRKQRT